MANRACYYNPVKSVGYVCWLRIIACQNEWFDARGRCFVWRACSFYVDRQIVLWRNTRFFTRGNRHRGNLQLVVPLSIVLRQYLFERVENSNPLHLFVPGTFYRIVRSYSDQARHQRKTPVMLLLSNALSGPKEGDTSASTGRVMSPSVRWKRMHPIMWRGDLLALFKLISTGDTCRISDYFKVGWARTFCSAMHGTSLAVSTDMSSTSCWFILAETVTLVDEAFGAGGYFRHSHKDDAWKAAKLLSLLTFGCTFRAFVYIASGHLGCMHGLWRYGRKLLFPGTSLFAELCTCFLPLVKP